jgi:hypothetical protein
VVAVVGVAGVAGAAALVAAEAGDAVADVVGDVGLTGSADARGTTTAAQAAPRAMKPRVERPNVTARVMESSFVLAASVFPGLSVHFARHSTAVTHTAKVAGQHGSTQQIFTFVD